MHLKLSNKVAVITGAARGIGRACAERLLADGCRVVIADIDTATLATTLDELRKISKEVIQVQADVSRQSEVEYSVKAAVERFGRLDIMINNAGIAISKAFLSVT